MDKEKALKLMWEIRENITNYDCYMDYREAMREGIRALEKQIAKKPIYSDFEDYNDDGRMIPTKAVCPACGEEFEFDTWNDEDNHHCTCGQAIDWELKLRFNGGSMNREWVEKLIKLMQENPDLPVLCKVDSDIVAEDGYAWWLGEFNTKCDPEIDEYSTNADDKLFLKSDEDYTEWFEHFFDYEDYDYGDLNYIPDDEWDEFAKEKVDKVAGWKKAIFISVTTTVC